MKTKQSKGQRLGWEDRKHATKVLLNENMLTGKVVHKSNYRPFNNLLEYGYKNKTNTCPFW